MKVREIREGEIREGDIVEIDYIEKFTKEHINEGLALVIWKGFNHQPLVRKLNTRVTTWDLYEHISKVVGHIDIEGYMDKALSEAEYFYEVRERGCMIEEEDGVEDYEEDYEDRPEVQMMLVDTEGGEVWF